MTRKDENPFRVYLEPLDDPARYLGYEEQIEELKNALDEPGVTVVLSNSGFGKTSLFRTREKLGWGELAQNLSKEEIYSIIRKRQPIFDRLLGKPIERKIDAPLFVDECGTLGDPEVHALLTNLYDNGTKIVMALNIDQKNEFNHPKYTIFDRKTREIILDGFTEEQIQKFVEENGQGRFDQALIEHFKNNRDYRKPRTLAIECHSLWEKASQKPDKKITLDLVAKVKVAEDRSALVTGKKSKQILDYITVHPGCARKEIVTTLNLPPNSASNLIRYMKHDGIIRQDEKGRYYTTATTTEQPPVGEAKT